MLDSRFPRRFGAENAGGNAKLNSTLLISMHIVPCTHSRPGLYNKYAGNVREPASAPISYLFGTLDH